MGDAKAGPVRLSFNPQLRVEFRGATVTSDAGLLLPRELDERLGLRTLIERHLADPRTGHNSQFPLPDLFRQSIYSRLAGYEDTNDAERLAEDPTFRMLASRERREISVALTSTLHWFETEVLAEARNYQGLVRLNTALVQHEGVRSSTQRVTLASLPRSGPATSTAQTDGRTSSCPSLTATRLASKPSSSEPTRPLPSPRCTRRWNDGTWPMPSGSRPIRCWSGESRTCSPGPEADQATRRWSGIGASIIRRPPGTARDG